MNASQNMNAIQSCGFKELIEVFHNDYCYDSIGDEDEIKNLSKKHKCSSNLTLYYILEDDLCGFTFNIYNAQKIDDTAIDSCAIGPCLMLFHLCSNSDILPLENLTIENFSENKIKKLDDDKCMVSAINEHHGGKKISCGEHRIRDREHTMTTCLPHEDQYRTIKNK